MSNLKTDLLAQLEVSQNKKFDGQKIFYSRNSLRLTWYGDKVFSESFEYSRFPCDISKLSPKHYVNFNNMEMPFYIGNNFVNVYSKFDAFAIQICETVEDYLNSFNFNIK